MNPIIANDLREIVAVDYINWERFRNKTVLITGANGMLPSYMVETLLYLNRTRAYNIKVLALVRNLSKGKACFPDYGETDGLYFIEQDVSTPLQYEGDIHFIVHAASQAAPSFYGKDPVGTIAANVLGTKNMLDLALEKKSESVLYFSSGGVYGDHSGDTEDVTESTMCTVNPSEVKSCYPISKMMGENLCVGYGHQFGLRTTMVRIVHTIGPHIQLNDGRAFADFTKAILENKDIVLKSDGIATHPFLYITDATFAFFKVMLDGEMSEAYNMGADFSNEISMRNLAQMLVDSYPEKGLKVIFDIDDNDLTYAKMRSPQQQIRYSYAKLKALGWKQSVNVKDAFLRTIDAKMLELNTLMGEGKYCITRKLFSLSERRFAA